MADARVVSNYLVNIAAQDENTLTPMQVIKLAYIAHGYRLGINGVPLISNRIEAWKFGPVIPSLYHAIKDRRDKPVRLLVVDGYEDISENEETLIKSVYEAYKKLDGIQLSNLTHQDDTPWHKVYKSGRGYIAISDDLIQNHYSAIVSG